MMKIRCTHVTACWWATMLLLSAPTAAVAQPIVIGRPLADGVYVLRVEGNRIVGFERATVLVPNLPVDPVIPVPPVRPVPPVIPVPPVPPVDRAGEIRAAAAGAVSDPQRLTTAANLATTLELISRQTVDGRLQGYPAISAAVNWMWDQTTAGREAAWLPVKSIIGRHLVAMAQEGAGDEAYAAYLAEAGKAIRPAVEEEGAILGEQQIGIELLNQLFEFFVLHILPLIQ